MTNQFELVKTDYVFEEPTYVVSFTADFIQYEEWAKENNDFSSKSWQERIERDPNELERQKKWAGKSIKLSELPSFIEEMGQCVINKGTIEVYNDYRE